MILNIKIFQHQINQIVRKIRINEMIENPFLSTEQVPKGWFDANMQQVSDLFINSAVYHERHDNSLFTSALKSSHIQMNIYENDLKQRRIRKYLLTLNNADKMNQVQTILLSDIQQFYRIYFVDKSAHYHIDVHNKQISFQFTHTVNWTQKKDNMVKKFTQCECNQIKDQKQFMFQYFGNKVQDLQAQLAVKSKQLQLFSTVYCFNMVNIKKSDLSDVEFVKKNDGYYEFLQIRKIKQKREKQWSQICWNFDKQFENLNGKKYSKSKNYKFSIQKQEQKYNICSLIKTKRMYIKFIQIKTGNSIQIFNDGQHLANGVKIEKLPEFHRVQFQVQLKPQAKCYSLNLFFDKEKKNNNNNHNHGNVFGGNTFNTGHQQDYVYKAKKYQVQEFQVFLGIKKVNQTVTARKL